LAPSGQAVVADTDGRDQPAGTDPGEARFWPGADPALRCAAPGLTWFGAGFGWAGFWVWPTARP
jgi:hypothetical protein